jgi:choline dehydrogenase-like flavoprotein
MATPTNAEHTAFSLDVSGRYVCNGLDEALHSTDRGARRSDGSPQNDARPFDVIVIGGGTFGAVAAAHIFNADIAHRRRVLVLEGGPFLLTEHVQDLPMIGLNVPGATSIADLRSAGTDRKPREEVWGLAWHSSTPFVGLAYCLGGRSLYFGGWSPQLLAGELHAGDQAANGWPQAVVDDLTNRYFDESGQQIGVDETNDFIFGALQNALRQQLFDGLNANLVTDAVDLTTMPDPQAVRALGALPAVDDLLRALGLPAAPGPGPDPQRLRNMLKLEAPLAVQTRTLSGFFPFNKFSAVPILMKAARSAESECGGDDVKKRLMVVPNCHVTRLTTGRTPGGLNVVAIETNQGTVPVQPATPVIIALGTIETTRLVLLAVQNQPIVTSPGQNLLAHLRSNLTIRVPRTALSTLAPSIKALQGAALFVKGRHRHGDGTFGYFHIQITAAGLGAMGTDSEAELFKKIPDIDTFNNFRNASETHVVITLRGIGEMEPRNPDNFVRLDPEVDEFGAQRSFVSLPNPADSQQAARNPKSAKDAALWDAMDKAADDLAKVFTGSGPVEVLGKNRDGLGTTHHEAGTLWIGDGAPGTCVTDVNCRLIDLSNAFVASPALFPRTGSPNPMLTGVALARRLGNFLAPVPLPYQPSDGLTPLFDGFSIGNWRMSTIKSQPGRDNPGRFIVVDGTLESVTGSDIGLLWCTTPMPADFVLRLEWLRWEDYDNSGVFIRFPDPESKGYNNSAFVAVDFGFEVQIDESGAPDGQDIHKTGAIYRGDGRHDGEVLTQKPARPVGQWNEYEIRVKGQNYSVFLNGDKVCVFDNPYAGRGLPSGPGAPTFVGLQTHTGRVAFRNIRFAPL